MVTVVRAVLEGHRQYPRITLKGSVTWLMRPFHKVSLVSLEVSLSGCLRVGVNTEQQVCRGRERGPGRPRGLHVGECHSIWALPLSAAFVSKTWIKTEGLRNLHRPRIWEE